MITITLQELEPLNNRLLSHDEQEIFENRNREARNLSNILNGLIGDKSCSNHKHDELLKEVRVVARMEYVKVNSFVCCHELDKELKTVLVNF